MKFFRVLYFIFVVHSIVNDTRSLQFIFEIAMMNHVMQKVRVRK
jgi:hypothetical protein